MIKIEQIAPRTFTLHTEYCGLSLNILSNNIETDEELTYIKSWLDENIGQSVYHLKPILGEAIILNPSQFGLLDEKSVYEIVVKYTISFKSNEHAMHFKLSWG